MGSNRMSRLIRRSYFQVQRNWKIDLERAVIISRLSLKDYYECNLKSPTPLAQLSLEEAQALKKSRDDLEEKFLHHILRRTPLETEKEYIDYDPQATPFFHKIDELEKTVSRLRQIHRYSEDQKRRKYHGKKLEEKTIFYEGKLKELENLYGDTHWIPSFVYFPNNEIDRYLLMAEVQIWRRIREKYVNLYEHCDYL